MTLMWAAGHVGPSCVAPHLLLTPYPCPPRTVSWPFYPLPSLPQMLTVHIAAAQRVLKSMLVTSLSHHTPASRTPEHRALLGAAPALACVRVCVHVCAHVCMCVRVCVFLCEGGAQGCWGHQELGFIGAEKDLGAAPLFGTLTACFQLLVVLLFISNQPQAIGSPSESPGILPVVSWPLEPQDGPVGVRGGEHVPQPQCWVDVVGNVPGARGGVGDILGGQQKVQV